MSYVEIDYEIEASCDFDGDFPLFCATLIFDLLKLNNVIIKNRYVARIEKEKVLEKYQNEQNLFYNHSKFPEGDYCMWIKEDYGSNRQLFDILKLQGIYLSCIAPTKSFDWELFISDWNIDEKELLNDGSASFVCSIIDSDRVLNLSFNADIYGENEITSILELWEKQITHYAIFKEFKKTVFKCKGKQLVRLNYY